MKKKPIITSKPVTPPSKPPEKDKKPIDTNIIFEGSNKTKVRKPKRKR